MKISLHSSEQQSNNYIKMFLNVNVLHQRNSVEIVYAEYINMCNIISQISPMEHSKNFDDDVCNDVSNILCKFLLWQSYVIP